MGRKTVAPLSVKEVIKKAKTPGFHAVGGTAGLYLKVTDEGARSWLLRYSFNGKRRDMGLGSFDDVTLEAARTKAQEWRGKAKAGIDPIAARRQTAATDKADAAKGTTFAECAQAFISMKGTEWKNLKHRQQWENTLTTYAYPSIGALPVGQVDTDRVLAVLTQPVKVLGAHYPLWNAKTETATRLRGRIENILDWAAAKPREYRSGDNPARWAGHLENSLPDPNRIRTVKNHAALPHKELGLFMTRLVKIDGMGSRALEFAILTAARSGEVRGATWSEIDFDAAVWTVPAKRMKGGIEHRVPLSGRAIQLLMRTPRYEGTDLIFPGMLNQPLSDMSLTAVLRRMADKGLVSAGLTVHGFRSTFRTWVSDTERSGDAAERALAHKPPTKLAQAYDRTDMFEPRRKLMNEWANFCDLAVLEAARTSPPVWTPPQRSFPGTSS